MKRIAILCFLIILISITAVSASENVNCSSDLSISDNVIYVDGGAGEDGDGSITKPFNNFQKALDNSQDNSTIYISSGVYSGNLNTNLTINKTLNLVKLGDDDVIFDGLNQSNIFTIKSTTFNVDNITFRNAYADNGGALYFENGLLDSKINAAFLNNHATDNGGAIYVDGECKNNIFNGYYSDNEAYSGGGIYFNESVSDNIFDTYFSRNGATYCGGGIYFDNPTFNNIFCGCFIGNYVNVSTGSAIYFSSPSRNDTFNGDFINNSVKYYGTLMFDSTLCENVFSGNFIGNTASFDGAAVSIAWDVENCTFSGNFISNYVEQFDGAAIYILGDSYNNLFNGYFANNHAPEGAVISFSISKNDKITGTFINNTADAFGCALLYCDNVDKLYVNATFINNYIKRSGGVITFYRNFANNITNCVIAGDFINNTADNVGGAIYFYTYLCENNTISANFYNNTASQGSAIYLRCENITNTTFINSNFISNKANSSSIDYSVDDNNLSVHASLKGYNKYINAISSWNNEQLHFVNVTYLNADGIVNSDDVILNASDLEAGQNLTLEVYKEDKCVLNITKASDNDGYASFDYSSLDYGNYTCLLYHKDSDYYNFILKEFNLTIHMGYLTIINATNVVYGENVIITVNATDENYNPFNNGTVSCTIDGKVYSANVENGLAVLVIPKLNVGNYAVNLTYSGNQHVAISQTSFNVSKQNAEIVAVNKAYIINYGGKYSMKLKDIAGNVLSGKTVTFTLAGKFIKSAITNVKGVATITLTANVLKSLKSGNKRLAIKFDDPNYKASKTVKITVNKEKTKIVAKNQKFKRTAKVKKYVMALKNSKAKPVKKVWTTLKVNGKTYKAKTNSKGKATFKITKLTKKGKFGAIVKFAGNNYYKATSKKVKITVK